MNRRIAGLIAFGELAMAPAMLAAQRGRGSDPNRAPGQQVPPGQRIGQLLRQRLELTDAQIPRLQETIRRFRDRRQGLLDEERQVRASIRDFVCSADTTHGTEVSNLLGQWHDIAKKRLVLQEDEQKELSTFLSSYQRAKYLGFEEQFERIMDAQGLRGRGGRAGRMPPPPDSAQGMRGGRAGRGGRQGMGQLPDAAGGRGAPGQLMPPNACGGPAAPPPPRTL